MKQQTPYYIRRMGLLLALVWWMDGVALHAQDVAPLAMRPQALLPSADTLMLYGHRTDTIALPPVRLPSTFRELADNRIIDSHDVLRGFLERLRLLRLGANHVDTLRIVHVGDSHIRGHIFPQAAGDVLRALFPHLAYDDFGINGAVCTTFTRDPNPTKIAALKPDLLILSFGTNESHNRRYDPVAHRRQMEQLLAVIRSRLPNVPILLTTPPGSYDSNRQRNTRRRAYTVNPRTERAADEILRFADDHHLAVWDLYHICGGAKRACLNWQEAKLMRPDHVHYLPEAYELQGRLLAEAIVKAFNQFARSY